MKMKYIEQTFMGTANFGRRIQLAISEDELGLDRIMLKFVLPTLGKHLKYKKLCVYDLIYKLEIIIGEHTIVSLNSENLKMIDSVERDFKKIKKCCKMTNHTIIYPIDLSCFFKKSELAPSEYKYFDITHPKLYGSRTGPPSNVKPNIPFDFEGLRIVDINDQIRLSVQLNELANIVNATDSDRYFLSGLQLECLSAFCNYYPGNKLPQPNKLCQQIRTWKSAEINVYSHNHQYKLNIVNTKNLTVIIYSDMLYNISAVSLQINANYVLDCMNLLDYKRIYEYDHAPLHENVIVLTTAIPGADSIVRLDFTFEKQMDMSMHIMYNVDVTGIYDNGRLEFKS